MENYVNEWKSEKRSRKKKSRRKNKQQIDVSVSLTVMWVCAGYLKILNDRLVNSRIISPSGKDAFLWAGGESVRDITWSDISTSVFISFLAAIYVRSWYMRESFETSEKMKKNVEFLIWINQIYSLWKKNNRNENSAKPVKNRCEHETGREGKRWKRSNVCRVSVKAWSCNRNPHKSRRPNERFFLLTPFSLYGNV